ncbi:hypothetical protein SAMN05421753_11270 [Planctomicrobium piriforme]|uniref:Solute:sodium symporter small subunit n=1 Tax=Planctomicrobium piriforme TaxID=1576369 RepID=A0A1I3KXH5_9PLAN|nr:hypothetical protein SAMN05421753_11270 [Planctomicrobium piriforme]
MPKIDQGFCLWYWRLSTRRKFIRELWLGSLVNIALIVAQLSGVLPDLLRNYSDLPSVALGWWICVFMVVCQAIILSVLWIMWRHEHIREQKDLSSKVF